MKNKKGNINFVSIIGTIMTFSLVSIMFIFMNYFLFAIGNDYIVAPLVDIGDYTTYSPMIKEQFDIVGQRYQNTNLDIIDNVFFLSYIILVISSFIGAYASRGMDYFSFLSLLTYGLMFILFLMGIVVTVVNFLYYDIMLNMYDNLLINLPLFDFYLSNIMILTLVHVSGLMLLLVVDFDFSYFKQRRKKETTAIGEDEIV